MEFIKENHDKITPMDQIFHKFYEKVTEEPFEYIKSSFCDGVIIRRVPDLFDSEIKVKNLMLEFGLPVSKVKHANLRNSNDLSEWFIRFDDAHCKCNHDFM